MLSFKKRSNLNSITFFGELKWQKDVQHVEGWQRSLQNFPARNAISISYAATTAGKPETNIPVNVDLLAREVIKMGDVAVTIKVFPESPEKLEEVKKAVRELVKVVKVEEEAIGFGLSAAIITFVMGDAGGLDELEEKIAALPNVSQVQVADVNRL